MVHRRGARRPPFAAAIAAYCLESYLGDAAVLARFSAVPHLERLLVRVAMRRLLRLLHDAPRRVPELTYLPEFARPAALIACRADRAG